MKKLYTTTTVNDLHCSRSSYSLSGVMGVSLAVMTAFLSNVSPVNAGVFFNTKDVLSNNVVVKKKDKSVKVSAPVSKKTTTSYDDSTTSSVGIISVDVTASATGV
ncbi:hypothetical protein [Bartonella taylorii]|uniref:hypothetical protein n=1 Tax=Bartonella taylorii TaxID=33046 RepID=UPI001ABA21C2|nr:hypothetical protein [Bartonella taylorii]